MNEITKENIVKRWDKLARADLGSWISPRAAQIRNFFESMFSHESYRAGDTWYWSSDFDSCDDIICIIRGFQLNAGYYSEDGLILAFSLDLHTVSMSEEVLEDFDRYLMMQSTPHREIVHNWLWYWQGLVQSEMKPTKKRRSRKTA